MMEKQKYYVNVSNHEIITAPQEDSELEIIAGKEDVTRLQQMFDHMDLEDKQVTVERSKTPYERFDTLPVREDQDKRNEPLDQNLANIYKLIYDLGTARTRHHIEEMNLLEKVDPNL